MSNYLYEEDTYKIIGALMEVHKNLGKGFSEIVYKDAFEYELKTNGIFFEREKEYLVHYKDIVLNHKFYADFVIVDKIILEIKSTESLHEKHISQCLNYLHVSGHRLAILVNFNKTSLEYKRIIK
ncbi:GxxExxY protein [Flavobacterium sp. CG_9.1]|uniref:GxxExxY protein n=1 Tax=Flavobacterium sp. CG_9.1 TaxID=2787728 RepID=UPI0018C983C2|nr:GxxExxY protein [Flavobacterium sp. CG_9.1]MBG6061487.1 GxxExxY protein [Flavobacterium sp. CG_9.1]